MQPVQDKGQKLLRILLLEAIETRGVSAYSELHGRSKGSKSQSYLKLQECMCQAYQEEGVRLRHSV